MRFAAFGRTRILYDSIKALVAAGHIPRIVGTCRASPESEIKEADFARLAAEFAVDFFDSAAINSDEIVAKLARAGAEVAVSVNWLTVIKERVCDLFPVACSIVMRVIYPGIGATPLMPMRFFRMSRTWVCAFTRWSRVSSIQGQSWYADRCR